MVFMYDTLNGIIMATSCYDRNLNDDNHIFKFDIHFFCFNYVTVSHIFRAILAVKRLFVIVVRTKPIVVTDTSCVIGFFQCPRCTLKVCQGFIFYEFFYFNDK